MLEVTCAIIRKEDKILICQRSERMRLPLQWEFPGGKVEPGESLEACVIREIQEELHITIQVLESYTPVVHRTSDVSFTLFPFVCQYTSGNLLAAEHAQVKWVAPEELLQYDWAEADLPIVKELLDNYENR